MPNYTKRLNRLATERDMLEDRLKQVVKKGFSKQFTPDQSRRLKERHTKIQKKLTENLLKMSQCVENIIDNTLTELKVITDDDTLVDDAVASLLGMH